MELKSYLNNIKLLMGYSDIISRVYIDVLCALYVCLRLILCNIYF